MIKKRKNIQKSVETHSFEARTINHHEEVAEELFPTLLDPEGTLADCYIMHLENEFEKTDD